MHFSEAGAMHTRRVKLAAPWSTIWSRVALGGHSMIQSGQHRSLSELYNQAKKKQTDKDTKDRANSQPLVDTISSIPHSRIRTREPTADSPISRWSVKKENNIVKDPKEVAGSYTLQLHESSWDGEETWMRFSRLPRKSIPYLRDIDVNVTLARIRGTERASAQGNRAAPTSMTLTRMLNVYETIKQAGIVPDRFTYQELIAVNVSLLKFKHAREWLEKMVSQGIKPTIRPYRTLLKGYSTRTDEIDNARRIWQDIKNGIERGLIVSENSDNQTAKLDLSTFTCYIAAESNVGNFSKVLDILDEMTAAGVVPDTTVRNTVLDGVLRLKGLDAGLQEARLMEQSGFKLDGYTYMLLLNTAVGENRSDDIRLLLAEAAARNVVPPARVIQKLPLNPFAVLNIMANIHDEYKTRLYNTLIEAAMRRNDFGQVLRIVGHLRSHNVTANVVTYTMLLDALNKAKRLEQAKDMFKKVFDTGKLKPDAHIFGIMIDACGRHGDIRGMFWFKTEMRKRGLVAGEFIYNSVLAALSRWRRGNLQAVIMVANEMVRSKPPVKPTTRTLNAIFAAFAAQTQHRRLGEGELQFLRAWYSDTSDTYFVTKDSYMYLLAINAFVGAGCMEDAMGVFLDMMRHAEWNPSVTKRVSARPQCILDIMRLAIERQEFDTTLRVWKDWLRLRTLPPGKATEMALFACDQMSRPDIAQEIFHGLLTRPNTGHSSSVDAGKSSEVGDVENMAFCPGIVDESVLVMYIAIMVKHNHLDTIIPAVELWTTAMQAMDQDDITSIGSEIRTAHRLSVPTVLKVIELLRGHKDSAATKLIAELLAYIEKHFPDAIPV
ncbi:hypothetical protein H4S08_001588 [Coemansia sp. RSA 1365]|nr:hypothetical protein H4S08_001588 [Coemansia sp. RSA 1365]